jgi:hypothetical protein
MTTADHAQSVASSDIDETPYVPHRAPPPPSALIQLSCAGDVYRNLANIRTKDREHFVVFFLNVRTPRHSPSNRRDRDSHRRRLSSPRDLQARHRLLGRGHHRRAQPPVQRPDPSRADLELTTRLREVSELVGIPLLDHIVVCADGFVSLAERGWR